MNRQSMENGYLKYWKDMNKKAYKIVLLTLLLLFFGAVVVLGEDKVGQGEVVDLTNSKPKEGIVFAVCIFAVGEDGKKYLVDHRHAENMGECIKKEEKQLINIKILNTENLWAAQDLCLCVIKSKLK